MFSEIGYLLSEYASSYWYGIFATIVLSLVGTFGGLFLGIFLAFGKKLDTEKKPVLWLLKGPCNLYSVVIRGTPMMVQAMIFKYGCQLLGVNWNNVLPGVNTFNGWLIAGLIVIVLNTTAYMGEIIQAGLNGVDNGQIEGAKSLGMTPMQTLFNVSLPQALRNSIPTIGNEWIVNIKDSSVLNVISVSELFWQANAAASKNYMYMATYVIIAIIYLILTLLSTGILKLVELGMDGKLKQFKFSSLFFHYHAKEGN